MRIAILKLLERQVLRKRGSRMGRSQSNATTPECPSRNTCILSVWRFKPLSKGCTEAEPSAKALRLRSYQ